MIHVACAFDDGMACPAVSLLRSIARQQKDCPTTIHIMHSGLARERVDQIASVVSGKAIELRWYAADLYALSNYKHPSYPSAVYLRLELFKRMKTVRRCIYLDADTMVRRPLRELFEIDLQGQPLAAVEDLAFWNLHSSYRYGGQEYKASDYLSGPLGMSQRRYLNSGVLVVDLEHWRNRNIGDAVVDFCLQHDVLEMVDQDAINHVLDGNFKDLDARWNSFSYLKYLPGADPYGDDLWSHRIKQWSEDPYIVHFTWKTKPWEPHHLSTDYDQEFWEHIKGTFAYPILLSRFEAERRKRGRVGARFLRQPGQVRHDEYYRAAYLADLPSPAVQEVRFPAVQKKVAEGAYTLAYFFSRLSTSSRSAAAVSKYFERTGRYMFWRLGLGQSN